MDQLSKEGVTGKDDEWNAGYARDWGKCADVRVYTGSGSIG